LGNISLRREPLLSQHFGALHGTATRRALWLPALFLQRGAKFREGMENSLRQNEDHNHESDRKTLSVTSHGRESLKAKTEKENLNKK